MLSNVDEKDCQIHREKIDEKIAVLDKKIDDLEDDSKSLDTRLEKIEKSLEKIADWFVYGVITLSITGITGTIGFILTQVISKR